MTNSTQQPSPPSTTAKALGIKHPRFTGFFFAINISAISRAAYLHPLKLFDDKNSVMINQEFYILRKMYENGVERPVIAITAFVHHFRSVTVSAALIRSRNGRASYDGKDGKDSRENLSHFHPELSKSSEFKSSYQYIPAFYASYIPPVTIPTCTNLTVAIGFVAFSKSITTIVSFVQYSYRCCEPGDGGRCYLLVAKTSM